MGIVNSLKLEKRHRRDLPESLHTFLEQTEVLNRDGHPPLNLKDLLRDREAGLKQVANDLHGWIMLQYAVRVQNLKMQMQLEQARQFLNKYQELFRLYQFPRRTNLGRKSSRQRDRLYTQVEAFIRDLD